MDEYKAMYYHLFNAATDALEYLEAGEVEEAKETLYRAQRRLDAMTRIGLLFGRMRRKTSFPSFRRKNDLQKYQRLLDI